MSSGFEYSASQFAQIAACLPPGTNLEEVSSWLDIYAEAYVSETSARRGEAGDIVEAKKSRELAAAVEKAAALFGEVFPNGLVNSTGRQRLEGRVGAEQSKFIADLFDVIASTANRRAEFYGVEAKAWEGNKNPARGELIVNVLDVWVMFCSGGVGYSTDEKNRRKGPTVRFLKACLEPVLGEEMLKDTALKYAIAAFKKAHFEERDSLEGLTDREQTAVAMKRLSDKLAASRPRNIFDAPFSKE